MNFDNDEEALVFINRLLEQMHLLENEKKEVWKNGKGIEIHIYKPGSQHVDHVENQYFGTNTHPLPKGREDDSPPSSLTPDLCIPETSAKRLSTKGAQESSPTRSLSKGRGGMPEPLVTNEAMALWEKAQTAGYVDENYQPLISRTQAALLADAMAGRLGIKEKWKVFERLWNRKYMSSDYNLALNQQQSLDFQDEIKKLF